MDRVCDGAAQRHGGEQGRDGNTDTDCVLQEQKPSAASGPGLVHEGPQTPAAPQEDSFTQTRTQNG